MFENTQFIQDITNTSFVGQDSSTAPGSSFTGPCLGCRRLVLCPSVAGQVALSTRIAPIAHARCAHSQKRRHNSCFLLACTVNTGISRRRSPTTTRNQQMQSPARHIFCLTDQPSSGILGSSTLTFLERCPRNTHSRAGVPISRTEHKLSRKWVQWVCPIGSLVRK